MPPEFWLAVAAGTLSAGSALCIVLIRRQPVKSSVPVRAVTCVDEGNCEKRMESQEKLFKSELRTISTRLDGVVQRQDEQVVQLVNIHQTTTEILKAVKIS